MQLFLSDTPLTWGELDIPLLGINADWFGSPLVPPVAFSVASDSENLWFIATRQAPASVHPLAKPGAFTPELWKFDTAELFIGDPDNGEYLEFNLAPNGAWWASKFSTVRKNAEIQPDFENHIDTYQQDGDPGSWIAAMAVPLEFLKSHINFGTETTANTTFILNSPAQTFHRATPLPGKEPDFHQPSHFQKILPCKLPES